MLHYNHIEWHYFVDQEYKDLTQFSNFLNVLTCDVLSFAFFIVAYNGVAAKGVCPPPHHSNDKIGITKIREERGEGERHVESGT